MLLLVAMWSVARAEPPPPPPPPPPGSAPAIVPPTALEAQRIAGNKLIQPDDMTKTEITRSGRDKIIGSFKLCLTVEGKVASVTRLKSSGFPAYDQKIIDTIQREWRYTPYALNGKPVPVCTAVTFIYSQQPAVPDPAPTVKLVKPGKAPRQVLRMSFTAGDKHSAVIDWQSSTVHGDSGAPENAGLRYELGYDVSDVAPSGDAHVEVTYRKIEFAAAEPDSKELNAKIAQLANTTAHATITTRGRVQDFELAPGVPAPLQEVFELGALRPIAESLPEEPVGVGAVWEVGRELTAGDVTFTMTTVYEVKAIAGSRVTLKIVENQNGSGGRSASGMQATGKAEAVIDLRGAVPSSVKLDETQDIVNLDTAKRVERQTNKITMTAR